MDKQISFYHIAKKRIALEIQNYRVRKYEKLEESAHEKVENFEHQDAGVLFRKAAAYARKSGDHQKEIDLLQRAASNFEEDAQAKAIRANLLSNELLRRIREPEPYDFIGDYEEDERLMREQRRELLMSAFNGFLRAAHAIKETGEPYFENRYLRLNSKAETSLRISFI